MARAALTALVAALALTACSGGVSREEAQAELDAAAWTYLDLVLEIGEREPGYVDAYYGPPERAQKAADAPRTVEELIAAAAALSARLEAVPEARLDEAWRQRRAYLLAHVGAASARLRMIGGQILPFADEAEALFGVRPQVQPLETYDPLLARIGELVPGDGPLAARVDAFKTRYVIPPERLQAVMDAAIAECRARTVAHFDLPEQERFTLEFVTDQPWSGYNWYRGGADSLIQINTDLPIYIDRAVDLGCHEGYPGHHVYNMLLERTFVDERRWVEMSVYPLFSPMSFVAEGTANYGIDLAFPGEQRVRFEREVLYPLAGLDPAGAAAYDELRALSRGLQGAESTIAAAYLDGQIDRETAIGQLQTYQLSSRARAEQRLAFIEKYRSYIINYGLGRDIAQAWVESHGDTAEAHWAAMGRLLSSQILPADLTGSAETGE